MKEWIWIKIYCPVWSFIVNFGFWIWNIFSLKQTFKDKSKLTDSIKSVSDIQKLMKSFTWTEDRMKDWRPWVITLVKRDYHDDCDGAAALAKFLFRQIGINGKIYNLYGKKTGHAIFVSDDQSIMVSNDRVLVGKWTDSQIKIYFNLVYQRIIK